MIKILLPALAVLAGFGTGAACAAQPGDVSLNADKTVVTVNHAARAYTPLLANPGKKPVIFDNLGTHYPKGVYIADTGYTIGGPQGLIGQVWFATAFTPAANASVTEIDVAVGYIAGNTDEVLVKLYADNGGVPGAEIWSHKTSMPVAGDCCAVAKIHDRAGIPVKAGTQYWLGVVSSPHASDIFAAWSFNDTDQVDPNPTAENLGGGWIAGSSLPNAAFAIYGG